jgi:hypothetical protein
MQVLGIAVISAGHHVIESSLSGNSVGAGCAKGSSQRQEWYPQAFAPLTFNR